MYPGLDQLGRGRCGLPARSDGRAALPRAYGGGLGGAGEGSGRPGDRTSPLGVARRGSSRGSPSLDHLWRARPCGGDAGMAETPMTSRSAGLRIALAAILVQAPRLVLVVLGADRMPVPASAERALLVVAGVGTALVAGPLDIGICRERRCGVHGRRCPAGRRLIG